MAARDMKPGLVQATVYVDQGSWDRLREMSVRRPTTSASAIVAALIDAFMELDPDAQAVVIERARAAKASRRQKPS